MRLQGLHRVGATRGIKPAGFRQQWRQKPTINPYWKKQGFNENGVNLAHDFHAQIFFCSDPVARSMAWCSCFCVARALEVLATTTISCPATNSSWWRRNHSRRCLRMRFRTTAFPTLLETVKPNRVTPRELGRNKASSTPDATFWFGSF